jgi:oligopeptide transport system substrate-binding protein
MRKAKWIFFGYLALVVLIVGGIAVSFNAVPPHDPHSLYYPLIGMIKTLDPSEVNDQIGADLVGLCYESLYNYKYKVRPYEIFPELAAEMPRLSPDGMTMTIPLRHGIHFYDPHHEVFKDGVGPELKASDVVYTFKHLCDFNFGSPNYSLFQGVFAGGDDWWEYTKKTPEAQIDWDKPIEGIAALDDYTVQFKLTQPNPQLIYKLAFQSSGIVCRKAVEYYKDNFRRQSVGTGPYALDTFRPDERLVYVANPIYRGAPDIDGTTPLAENDPQRMPHVKRLQLDFFVEQLPVWLLFEQGLFDGLGDIPSDSFKGAIDEHGNLRESLKEKKIVLNKVPWASLDYIAFNMNDQVVGTNKPLRQAMSMALNRARYIKDFWMGRGVPANGLIPPGLTTYDPNHVDPYSQFDIPKALELMKEAEKVQHGKIPTIKMVMRDADTLSRQMAEFFTIQMRQIGVDLQPEFRDFARWQEMVDNRQTQIFDAGWIGDYPDEQDFFQLYYSKNIPNGGLNSCCYNNPKFDALYEKATIMQDSPQRRELYLQMARILDEDCPSIWVYYPVVYSLRYQWVGNTGWMDYGYGYRQYNTLDEKMRAQTFASGVFRH